MIPRRNARLVLALIVAIGCAPALAQSPGPQGPEQGAYRQQLWLVPSQDRRVLMRTVVFRPKGPGPFPLVVINHGSTQDAEERATLPQPVFAAASEWFVARGYAVAVPQRPGHGETGGPYLEGNSSDGGCSNVDYRKSGLVTADSIMAAIDFMTRQSFVRHSDVVVVGQSVGGWGSLALASRNPHNVRAVINFAGGRGGRINGRANSNCAPDKLVDAASSYGATARIPVLSLYTENDSYFGPALSKRVNDAFRIAGGRVDYRLLPAFGNDGHALLDARSGVAVWAPAVDEFLKGVR